MGALTAPVPVPSAAGGAYGVGGGHYPGGLRELDGHRVDVDPDYVLLQLLQGFSPRQTA